MSQSELSFALSAAGIILAIGIIVGLAAVGFSIKFTRQLAAELEPEPVSPPAPEQAPHGDADTQQSK